MDLNSIGIGLSIAVIAAISIGAILKGITGLGLPMFAVPAIASITTVEDAVVIMIIPGMGANLWLIFNHRRFRDQLRAHRPFLIGGLIGGIVGTTLLVAIDDRWLRVILVLWLAMYLILYFTGSKAQSILKVRGGAASILGLVAGTAQGSTGISAHIVAPYFHDRSMAPAAYAFLVASAFLVFAIAQSTAVLASPLLTEARLLLGLAALVPTLLFTRIGIALSHRVSQTAFTNLLLFMFVAMELKLIVDVVRSFQGY